MGRKNHGIATGRLVFNMKLINKTAKVPGSFSVFADVGVAICDFENNLILDTRKRLEEAKHMNDEMTEIETVVQGLNATLSLNLKRVIVSVDDFSDYQYLVGILQPRQNKMGTIVNEVALLQKKFRFFQSSLVIRDDVKFVFKLARDASVS